MDLQRHIWAVAIVRNNHQTIVVSLKNKQSIIAELRFFFTFHELNN